MSAPHPALASLGPPSPRFAGRGYRRPDLPLHDHGRAELDPVVEIDDVVVGQPDAAGGRCRADRVRLVRAVDTVHGVAEIESARAERIVGTAGHVARQIRAALQHLVGRSPIRPLALGAYRGNAAPGEAVAADADAVAKRLALPEHQVGPTLAGAD